MKSIYITIVGGGFGGIYTLKKFNKIFNKNSNIHITLVSENNYFLFTPLLHEVATGGINPQNIIEPIKKFLGSSLNTLYVGKVTNIDIKNSKIETRNRYWDYDYLVLAPGAETNFFNTPGAEENCFTLKSLEDAIKIKNHCITLIDKASFISSREERKNILRFVIIGGGPTGVELASELEEFLKQTFLRYYTKDLIDDISVVIIQKDSELLVQLSKPLREKSLKILQKNGVEVILNALVNKVTKDGIEFNNKSLKTNTAIWVAGVKPINISFSPSISLENNGRLKVNQYLQLDQYSNVYALGDISGAKEDNGIFIPMLAQVATREANIVAENIKNQIEDKTLKPFIYKNIGTLISLGRWMAVGEISHFIMSGHFTWFVWRTIYLSKLISWQKKVKVAIDWTINIFSERDISKL